MGWVSFREDLCERRVELLGICERFQREETISNEEKVVVVSTLRKIVDSLDSLETFVTDPQNDTGVENLRLKYEMHWMQSKIDGTEASKMKIEAEWTKRCDEIAAELCNAKQTIDFLKKELKETNSKLRRQDAKLEAIYRQHPEIGYDDYPPPNKDNV